MKNKYKDREEVLIDGNNYYYIEFYNRLESFEINKDGYYAHGDPKIPSIKCPNCHNHKLSFHIGRGFDDNELHCECGEIMGMD